MTSVRRRSNGCGNCRRAKKGCNLKLPTCGRCQRLHLACGDYPGQGGDNISYLRLDASAKAKIQTTLLESSDPIPAIASHSVDDWGFSHLPEDWSLLFNVFASHELIERVMALFVSLLKPVHLVDPLETSIANISRMDVMKSVRAAVLDERKRKEDATLVASILLASFERFDRPCVKSLDEWTIHADGVSCLAENRGIPQLRTKTGRAIFRKARQIIIDAAFSRNIGAPSFIILYSQAMKYDAGNNMDDQLAILEARSTHMWSRYCACHPDSGLYEESLTFRHDLELLEQDYCISRTRWSKSFSDCGTKQNLRAGERIQSQWFKLRLETCRIVALRIEADYCGKKRQNEDTFLESRTTQARFSIPSTSLRLCASAASALEVVEELRVLDVPVANALGLAIPLYVIAITLIDELHEESYHLDLGLGQYHGSLELLKAQISYATEALQDLRETASDQNSSKLMDAIQERQYKRNERTISRWLEH